MRSADKYALGLIGIVGLTADIHTKQRAVAQTTQANIHSLLSTFLNWSLRWGRPANHNWTSLVIVNVYLAAVGDFLSSPKLSQRELATLGLFALHHVF